MNPSFLKSIPVKPSEITPEALYLSRRDFLKSAAIWGQEPSWLPAPGRRKASSRHRWA